MELLESVRRTGATRQFDDEPVTEDEIRFLLDTARMAGSGKNRQPWSFVVVQNDERRETLATFGDYTSPLTEAPVGIVVLADVRESDDGDLDFNVFDCGRAVQNLVLAAASRGLGTVPQSIRDREAAERLLSIPASKRLLLAIAVGHPGDGPDDTIEGRDEEDVLIDSGRRPLDDLVYWERHD